MISGVFIDEFGYLTFVEDSGDSIQVHLNRSSLLEIHAQAFSAAVKQAHPGHEGGPPPLRIVEP